QEVAKETARSSSDATEANVSERVRLLENELERQNAKLDQLQKTIDQQQSSIQALLEKLGGDKSVATPMASVTEVAVKTPATESSPTQTQPSVEQRLAKVEGQVLKIGPVRLSGDFRLRFDGIFRSATTPPDPPLDHVQNARVRYRFRLNLDTELYPNLTFHGQLATGQLQNPLNTNQDCTSFAARAPIALTEAWVDYRPTKEIQLQGGRVHGIFADNSR